MGTVRLGRRDVLGQQVVHAVGADATATRIGEQRLILSPRRLSNPCSQHGAGTLAQWRAPLLASLADDADVGTNAELQVFMPQARSGSSQTQPGLHGQ